MPILLVILSVALAICLWLLFFRSSSTQTIASTQVVEQDKSQQRLQADLEKKRKEIEELKSALNDIKDELKQTKRKLFDQKQEDKTDNDLVKARAEVERQASIQLEIVRSELGSALSEIQRLKTETESKGSRRPVAAPVEPEKVTRVIRELSEAEKEKIDRLESQAQKDRSKAIELEKDVKRLKSRLDTQTRIYNVTKGEFELLKDKFKAIEKRLNRTLLERDLVVGALKILEKKSGVAAERTELTAEEIAASDQQVEAQQKKQAEEAAAKVQAVSEPSSASTEVAATPSAS